MTNIPKDPIILLSYINTQLRDHYNSLDALCDDLELNAQDLTSKLEVIDYHYHSDRNQFV